MLAAGADELVAVGDPDQSIYAFRGSDPQAIRRFPDVFAPASGQPVPVVALGASRRSGATLLASSRRIAARLPGPAAHRDLRPVRGTPPGRVEVHALRTAGEEAAYVADRLRPRTCSTACRGRRWRCWSGPPAAPAGAAPGARGRRGAVLGAPATRCRWSRSPRSRRSCGCWSARCGGCARRRSTAGSGPRPARPAGRGRRDHAAHLAARRGRRARAAPAAAGAAPARPGRRAAPAARPGCWSGAAGRPRCRRPGPGRPRAGRGRRGRRRGPDGPGRGRRAARRAGPAGRLAAGHRPATARAGGSAEDVLWAVWQASRLAEQWQRPVARPAARPAPPPTATWTPWSRCSTRAATSSTGCPAPDPGCSSTTCSRSRSRATRWPRRHRPATRSGCSPRTRPRVWSGRSSRSPACRRAAGRTCACAAPCSASSELVDVVAGREPEQLCPGRAAAGRGAAAVLRRRSPGPAGCCVRGVAGEDDQPSRFLDELDPPPPGGAAAGHPVPAGAVAAGAGRRAARGGQRRRRRSTPGAGPRPPSWPGWPPPGCAAPTRTTGGGWPRCPTPRPLADPGEPVRVSPSAWSGSSAASCAGCWSGRRPRVRAGWPQSVGTALHDVAAAAVTEEHHRRRGELGERLEAALDAARPRRRLDHPAGAGQGAGHARHVPALGALVPVPVRAGRRRGAVLGRGAGRRRRTVTRRCCPAGSTGWSATRTGRLVVVDLKTGRSKPADDELARHPQLGAYQLAVAPGAFGDGEPGGGVLVNLGTNAERARTQEQPPLGADDDPDWAGDRVARRRPAWAARSSGRCRARPAASARPAPPAPQSTPAARSPSE